MKLITPGHNRWDEFVLRLEGPEGIDVLVDPDDPDSMQYDCGGDQDGARTILEKMGLAPAEVEASLQYYRNHGGYCDCEILLNVDKPPWLR